MAVKNADAFFAAVSGTRRTTTVTVRGVEVSVKEMSARTRAEFLRVAANDMAEAVGVLARDCAIDANGQPLFSGEQLEKLLNEAPEFVDQIADAALDLSGMKEDKEGAEEKKS